MTNWVYGTIAIVLVWFFIIDDEDDDHDGGKMIPAYQRSE
jgi:hypothetical protein